MYAEWRPKGGSDDVVHTRIVCPVGEVKSFRDDLKLVPVGECDRTTHPHIETDVVRSNPAIPSGARWPVIGEMTIAIDIGASQQIKRMAAVVADNRTEHLASSFGNRAWANPVRGQYFLSMSNLYPRRGVSGSRRAEPLPPSSRRFSTTAESSGIAGQGHWRVWE